MPIWVGSLRGIRFEGSRKGHTLIGSYGKMIWKRKWNSLNIKISTKSSFCIQFLILNCCCSSLIIRSSNRAGIVVNCVFCCPQKMAKIRKQLMLILDQQVRVYQMLFFFLSKNAFMYEICVFVGTYRIIYLSVNTKKWLFDAWHKYFYAEITPNWKLIKIVKVN